MKTAKDPRHINRIKQMQSLFAWEFKRNGPLSEEIDQTEELLLSTTPEIKNQTLVQPIIQNIDLIDQKLQLAAPAWPIDKINRIDLAILRLAIYELFIAKNTPPKVVIDEAVELGKSYGSDTSPSFINGALGKLTQTSPLT